MSDLESEEFAEQRRNKKRRGLKILTPDQILSRLPIILAQLKTENNSERLKNEIRQLLYSWYRSKKLKKTVHNNLINTIKKIETISANTENNRKNEPHRFRLTLADNLILKVLIKNIALANLSIYWTWKNLHIATINLKFLLQLGMMNLICLMDHILFQSLKIFLSILLKA